MRLSLLPSFPSRRVRRGTTCFLACWAMLVTAASGLAADNFRAVLDGFTGAWEGEIQVFALDGFPLKTFSARRSYAWNGREQVVVTRFFDGTSDYEVRARQAVDLGRLQASVVRPGQAPEEYGGALEAGAVVWTNAAQNRRDFSERLVTTDGVTRLQTSSSEIMRVQGVSGVVRVNGTFARVDRPTAATLPPQPVTAPAPSGETPPAPRDQVDPQRVAWETRLADATTQAARVPALEKSVAELNRIAAAARAAEAKQSEANLELEVALAERAKELARLKAELDVARADTGAASEAREQRAALETRLAEAKALQHQLESEKAEQAADAQVRLTAVQAQAAAAQTARESAAAEAAKLTQELAVLRANSEKVQSGSAAESRRIAELERKVASAEKARGQHEETKQNLQQKLAGAEAAAAAGQAELIKVQAAASGVAEQLVGTKSQVEALQRRVADANAEASRLGARVKELEASTAASDEVQLAAKASSAAAVREQAAVHDQLAKLQRDLTASEAARTHAESEAEQLRSGGTELDQLRAASLAASARLVELEQRVAAAERRTGELLAEQARREDQLRAQTNASTTAAAELAAARQKGEQLEAHVAALSARPDLTSQSLADERRVAQERLEQAESGARAAASRVSELEAQLTAAGARVAATNANAAQSEAAAGRDQLEKLRAERDILTSRLAGAQEAVAGARAELHTVELAATAASGLRAELDTQRALVVQREEELARLQARNAAIIAERDAHAVRIAALEQQPESLPPPVAAGEGRNEVTAEIARLSRRVTELESERNAAREANAFGQKQLEQAQQLRDDTVARFRDVVAQLNTMRDDRDRLARDSVSLRSELRVAQGDDAPPPATTPSAPPAGGPSFLDRLMGNTEPPPSPPPAGADRAIEEKIAAFQVIGITRTPEEDKVILNGRLYRSGDIVDAELGLGFERIEGEALVFSDRAGREFRRKL